VTEQEQHAATASLPVPDGLQLRPFPALRYDASRVGDVGAVLAPPYDVIDDAGVGELEARDPHNVVRLTLPRDDGAPNSRYGAAARRLAEWRERGVLAADGEPTLYVYEESSAGHVQRGLLGAVGLAGPEAGIVLPHENTMAGPVADRLALQRATEANLEPIFLVYDGGGAASAAVASADAGAPLVDATTPDGIRHRLWALADRSVLERIAADLRHRSAVIADGHHRYATYLRYQAERHEAGDGPGPWDFGLAFLVDAQSFGPQVHAIHRVLRGLALDQAADGARNGFAVRDVQGDLTTALGALAEAGAGGAPAFLLAGYGRYVLLTDPKPDALRAAMPAGRSPAWQRLDVAVAHRLLIGSLWGLDDTVDTVDYAHDVAAAIRAAGAAGGTALLLNPTPVAAVAEVAAAGERMPRKSTLYTPKPATGLVLRALADET
jgi:uncharacterized protein (DUF1015 family)